MRTVEQPQRLASILETEVRQALERVQARQQDIRVTLDALDMLRGTLHVDCNTSSTDNEPVSDNSGATTDRGDTIVHNDSGLGGSDVDIDYTMESSDTPLIGAVGGLWDGEGLPNALHDSTDPEATSSHVSVVDQPMPSTSQGQFNIWLYKLFLRIIFKLYYMILYRL